MIHFDPSNAEAIYEKLSSILVQNLTGLSASAVPEAPVERTRVASETALADVPMDEIAQGSPADAEKIAAQVVAASGDAIIASDQNGAIMFWNRAAAQMFGYSASEALGQPVSILIPEPLVAGHTQAYANAVNGGPTTLVGAPVELVAQRADGSQFPIELSLTPWDESAVRRGYAAIVRDISDRKQLAKEREDARAFLTTVVSQMPAMFFVKDAHTREYLLINEFAERTIGRPASEVIGKTDVELFPAFGQAYMDRDTRVLNADGPLTFESEFVREDGQRSILKTTRAVISGANPSDRYILGVSEDVTRTRRAEAEVLRLALHDALTGLGNAASLTSRIHELIDSKTAFAMLSIDLDRFKSINDQFGHDVGDAVLTQFALRLRAATGDRGFLARTGGNEFAVILTGRQLQKRALKVSTGIVRRTCEPFDVHGGTAHCGASVGIVLCPEDGDCPAKLRERVDLALYRAKRGGGGNSCFFNREMDLAEHDRRKLEGDLRLAIARGEIDLAYQPVVCARTGRIKSCEALARWTHPSRGPIGPDIFISLAEECGLIGKLGEDLLRKACRDALSWPADVSVAVNLSANQFRNHTLPQMVGKVLAETGLNPRRLQLEVTESLVITDVEGTLRQLRDLRAQGIQILMDDFGTGYCSLSYFQQFCFDKVKLDKSFVRDVAVRESRAIIEAVIGLGQKLDMGIVAEGVETEQQMGLLVETGCTHLQGYLFGRPMPKGPIVDLLYSSSCQPGVIADPGIGLDYHATAYRERLRNSQGEYDRQACAG